MYNPATRRPVGTGPFRIRSWERGRRIVLERHAGYWGTPAEQLPRLLDTLPRAPVAVVVGRAGTEDKP